MAKKPPKLPGNLGGNKSTGGGSTLPPLPKGLGGGSKSKTSGSEEKTLKTMLGKYPGLSQYQYAIVAAAKVYRMSAVDLAAALIGESKSGRGVGVAGIVDGKVNGNWNSNPLVYPGAGAERTAYAGQQITQGMKQSALFSIFYLAWRVQGNMVDRGMSFAQAYSGPHGYNPSAPNPTAYIPNNYVPSSANATGGIDTTALASAARGIIATGTNPFVIYDDKTGKIAYSVSLNNKVLSYDGVPITRSTLMREVQDKAGIGGDYYNFTGQSPTPQKVASIMATGRNLQQLETAWIGDTNHFKDSPAGKKYFAGYQDAWSQIMGKNQPVPWQLVAEAAQSNLNETEFAAKLRMDGFAGQKQNSQWSYLQSNEFQSHVDAYTLSYEKIYGEPLKDPGMKNLASDAALAGWDSTQWEAYLRSLPQYTHTYEYQGHALGILNKLGMDFGFLSGLGSGGYTPPNPSDQLPGPPGDKRVAGGTGQQPGANTGDALGVTIPNA